MLIERVGTEAGEKEADEEHGRPKADLNYGIEYDKGKEATEDDHA